MKTLKKMKDKWQRMSACEKLQFGVEILCDAGATLMMAALGSRFYGEGDSRIKKFAINSTLFGLGMYTGSVSAKQINRLIKLADGTAEEDDDE